MKKLSVTLMVLALMLALLPATATAHTEGDPLVVDLLAGQTTDVGDVLVWNDADALYIKYVITGSGWCITETHLQVATSLAEIPQKNGNPIPGKFEENDKHACVSEVTYTYNLKEKGWAACDQQLHIAAHAVVCKTDGKGRGSCETAWGDGSDFSGKNWATYFAYTTPPCPCTNVPVVVNGDFEAPVVTHLSGWEIYDSGTDGLGWTVEWYGDSTEFGGQTRPETAHLELHESGTVVNAYMDEQYAELDTDWDGPGGGLNEEPASVRIYQDLDTCPGQTYTLQYAWSPRGGHPSKLEVYWGGQLVTSHSGDESEWHLETWTVTASGTSTRLAFIETGNPDAYGMFLDAVSVAKCDTCP